MKKLFFLFVLLLSSIGMSAVDFEVDGIRYNVLTTSPEYTVEVMGSNSSYEGNIILNGTVIYNEVTYSVVSIDDFAFSANSQLTGVGDLPSCTSIGQSAFSYCSNLGYVGDLSACTSIGNNAFRHCNNLRRVGDLSTCMTIGSDAFAECSSLRKVTIKDIAAWCNISFGNSLSNPLIYAGHLYSDSNTEIKNLVIPDGVTSIGDDVFHGCNSLTSVTIPSSVTSIGSSAFYGCNCLTSVEIPNSVMSIGNSAFTYCRSLTSVTIGNSVTSIGANAFYDCSGFSSLEIPNSVTSIGNNAFYNCSGLITVIIEGSESILSKNAFPSVGQTFIVPAAVLETYRSANGWADIRYQIIADNVTTEYDVTAPVLDAIGASNLTNVMRLKVTGDIDSEDIMFIRNNMVNLHHLDLTDANFKASTAEYASGKHTSENSVGGLYGLLRLISVKLPSSAKSIEGDAFYGCTYLSDITIPEGIERIEDSNNSYGPFFDCAFTSIILPNSLVYIGVRAFYGTKITSIILPEELIEIRNGAFQNVSLSSVTFSPKLKTIGAYAFLSCRLSTLSLPTSLTIIGEAAFENNSSLRELRIPSSVESIGAQAFQGCSSLRDVYVYVVDPIDINTNTFDTYGAATLHIPEQCENTYFRNPQWGQFLNMTTFNEPYTYFYATNDVVLDEGERFDAEEGEDIDFDGNAGSSITIEGDGDQELGYMDLFFDGIKWASVIANENLIAKHIRFHIPITGNRWHFFSFPFRVYLNKMTAPGSHVIRYYDGAQRANYGNSGWKPLPGNTEYLEAGVGYIFQCNQTGELIVEVDNPDFYWHGSNKTNPLTAYASSVSDQHASWNFVGNPMTNYYDIDDMGYSAPLTIWDGSSYQAYRPGDDNYQLSPFEAFFVQKPATGNDPTYTKDNRMSYNASQNKHAHKVAARRKSPEVRDRFLLNLVLSNGKDEDKTRVVFNEKTSKNYEMECDAAKFMSSEQVPQLYSVDQQTRYAINERPQGEVMLGFTAPVAGSYTLRADRMDAPVAVKDLVMGSIHDLRNGEYTFDTEAGTFESRFVLMLAGETTAINATTQNNDEPVSTYTLDGKQLPQGKTVKGVNIIRQGKEVKKVIK